MKQSVLLLALLSMPFHGQQAAEPNTSSTVTLSTAPIPPEDHSGAKPSRSGHVGIALVVDELGNPTHVHVVKSAGRDLDEKAIATAQTYKFKPAMKNGKPVKADLYLDVDIEITPPKNPEAPHDDQKPIVH